MTQEMLKPFSEEAHSVKEGALYEHYKGNQYTIISIARHSETLEEVVVYKSLYGEGDVWVRPLSMFLERVAIHGESVPRFKEIR